MQEIVDNWNQATEEMVQEQNEPISFLSMIYSIKVVAMKLA